MTTLEIPLAKDQDGVWRVQGSRVTLDTITASYEDGATPEEITLRYPSVALEDVYAVLGFMLKNREDVAKYLIARGEQAEQARQQNQARLAPQGIRTRLERRRQAPDD